MADTVPTPAPDLARVRSIYFDLFGEPLADRWRIAETVEEPPMGYFRQWKGFPAPVSFWIGRIHLTGARLGDLLEQLQIYLIPRASAAGLVDKPDMELTPTVLARGVQLTTTAWDIGRGRMERGRTMWLAVAQFVPRRSKPEFLYFERTPEGWDPTTPLLVGDVLARGVQHDSRRLSKGPEWRVIYAIEPPLVRLAVVESQREAHDLQRIIREGTDQ